MNRPRFTPPQMAAASVTLALSVVVTGVLYSSPCRTVNTDTWTETINSCPTYQGPGDYDPNCQEVVPGGPLYDGEVWQFTETTTLCYTGDCSPGQMSTDLQSEMISEGEIGCTTYNLVDLPEADPELCPTCECEDCDHQSQPSSLSFKIRLARATKLRHSSHLVIYQKDASKRLYTPGVLTLPSEEGLKVYRKADHSIRQIISADSFADVVVTSPESYEVRIYALPTDWKRERDAEGFLLPPGETLRTYRFRNPEPGSLEKIDIDIVIGKSTKTEQFAWQVGEGRWTLLKDADASQRTEAIESYDSARALLTRTSRTSDLKTGSVRDTVRIYRDYPFGRRLLSTEKLRDGKSLSKDIYTYGEDPAEVGAYGRLLSRQLHDGSWERFSYDARGRYVRKTTPWKDSPIDSPDDQVRVETYLYLTVDPASPHYHPSAQFVRIDEIIAGVKVATTYRLQTRDPLDGSHLRMEEHAARPGAHFGEKGNARTTTRYYPELEANPASGLVKSTATPDGRLTLHRYESGDYDGEEGMPGLFDPRVGGPFLRTIKIETVAEHPEGLPGRHLAAITVEDSRGSVLLEETRLLGQGDPAEGELLSWTGHAYDLGGRKLLDRDATGIVGEYRYNPCCGKLEWERDRDGTETSYIRDDANDRLTAKIVKAPGRVEVETHYQYGPFGQLESETVVAGDLVRETRHEYDDEGERITTTTPDGLITRFEHDHAELTHTTILPGGATRIEARYVDGQIKSVTGTSVVASHYDHGVDPGTGDRWTRTTAARADGPRWTRSVSDALGRTIRHEQPGHGTGVTLAALTAFDDKGRVVATQSAIRNSPTQVRPLGPPTLQTYDPNTGEALFAGQDLDGDGQLVPGTDRLTKSERRFEQIDGAWWELSRQWSYPLELKGQPSWVSETRQRLTGLGTPHSDPALGLLVAETVQSEPSLRSEPQHGADTAKLVTRSVTYRHRDSGLVTVIATDPQGRITEQRTEGGLLASVVDRNGADGEACCEHRFEYDGLGRRTAVHDPRTGTSKTYYDPKTGYVAAEVDPEGRRTVFAHYPAGHESAGRLAYTLDANGKESHIAYTPRGEQRAVWGDSVQPLVYERNDYGELVGMRTYQTTPEGDPSHHEDKSARTAWHYHEPTGALLRKEYADGHGPTYAYTESGQLKERQWARATPGSAGAPARNEGRLSTSYEYDPKHLQLLKSTATDGTEVTYEYDPESRLAKVTDASGTREFAYDLRGQVVKETVTLLTGPDTDPLRYEIRRTYTPQGQPESVHLVSGEGGAVALDHKVGYTWNAHGQLARVKSLAGEFRYEYDEKNPDLLTKMTGPVHEVETTYEPHRNLITGVVNRAKANPAAAPAADSGPRTLSSYFYTNDLLGRRETISQGGEAFALLKLGETRVDVAYNNRSEVVGATYQSANETRQEFSYDYDGIGNRRNSRSSVNGEQSSLSYESNALNQYTSIGSRDASSPKSEFRNPRHDLDGNLIEDDRHHYSWDSENRLIRAESKDGSSRIDYLYDHQSRRTVRTETKQPGTKDEEQRTTYFLYDAWNLLAELESSVSPSPDPSVSPIGENLQVRLFTWGRDLSGTLQGAGGVGGLLAITLREVLPSQEELGTKDHGPGTDGETLFPAYDANGNVSQLLDGSSAVVAAYSYDPFGNVTAMAGVEAERNSWRFSTKPVETGTGWLYYGFRYYDPEVGRWASRDPIAEKQFFDNYTASDDLDKKSIHDLIRASFGSLNSFSRNDPVNTFDVKGLVSPPILGVAAAVACIMPFYYAGLFKYPDSEGRRHCYTSCTASRTCSSTVTQVGGLGFEVATAGAAILLGNDPKLANAMSDIMANFNGSGCAGIETSTTLLGNVTRFCRESCKDCCERKYGP